MYIQATQSLKEFRMLFEAQNISSMITLNSTLKKSCHLQQHDALGGHYANRNKQDRERQTPHGITYIWNQKKKNLNSQKEKVEKLLSGVGGRGKQEEVSKRAQTFSYKMTKV